MVGSLRSVRFSQRHGYTAVKSVAQRESLDTETRNGLWSVLTLMVFEDAQGTHLYNVPPVEQLMRSLWMNFFKQPVDTLPTWGNDAVKRIRTYFFEAQWYEVLDFVEFVVQRHPYESQAERIRDLANGVLTRELSAYRFVGKTIAEITSAEEIAEIESAIDAAAPGPRTQLQQAVSLLADRSNPDYRNSIKESISAVEGTLNQLAGTSGLSLGDALKKLDIELHGAFRAALGNLYGYTSDGDGIRHSLLDEPNLDYADAKFMLVTCSAFVNYLTAKHGG